METIIDLAKAVKKAFREDFWWQSIREDFFSLISFFKKKK
jgi:hypothetical protein